MQRNPAGRLARGRRPGWSGLRRLLGAITDTITDTITGPISGRIPDSVVRCNSQPVTRPLTNPGAGNRHPRRMSRGQRRNGVPPGRIILLRRPHHGFGSR